MDPFSYGCCKEYNEAPPAKQDISPFTAPKLHKSAEQSPQIPAQQEHAPTPLTAENLSAISGGHKTQITSRTHRYKGSGAGISASAGAGPGPEIERIHRHGMDIINSTADENSEMEVPASAPKRPHPTRSGRKLPLYGEDADPGTKRRPTSWSEVNIPHKSPVQPSYPPSDSGGGSSVTSSSSSSSPSSSKPFHPGSYFKPKARLDLNVAGRGIHVLHVPGRIFQASFDDGYGMEYKFKIRKTKEPTGATHTPSVANPASN